VVLVLSPGEQVREIPPEDWELPQDPNEVVSRLTIQLEECRAAKEDIESNWGESQKLYDGEVWEAKVGPDRDKENVQQDDWTEGEKVSINLVKQAVSNKVPILLDSIPTLYVKAFNEAQDDAATQLETYLQALWHQNQALRELKKVYKDGLVLGTGAVKVFWNQTGRKTASPTGADPRVGFPDLSYLSPWSIFPDPNAERMEDCEFCFLRSVMSAGMVKRMYPGADLQSMETEDIQDRHPLHDYLKSDHGHAQRFQIWEAYHQFGDYLTIFSGREILWHGPNPIPGQQLPVVLFINDERGADLWGLADADGGGDEIQRAINKLFWRIFCHARLATNPTWRLIGPGTVTPDYTPGAIWQVIGGRAGETIFEPNIPPPLPAYVMPLLAQLIQLWESWTGIHDVTQGQRPAGITAGVAIQALQEAAQTSLRQTIRDWGLQIGEVGQQLLDLVTTFTVDQSTALLPQEQGAQRATIDPSQFRGPDGMPWPFRVVSMPQADLPLGQGPLLQLMMALMPTGAVDAQAILDVARVPGRQQILERMRQAQLAQFQQAVREETEAGFASETEQLKARVEQENMRADVTGE
jgi:hypothetical protein